MGVHYLYRLKGVSAALAAANSSLCARPYLFGADYACLDALDGETGELEGATDSYALFAQSAVNLARICVNGSTSISVSSLETKIARAKAMGMQALLDYGCVDDELPGRSANAGILLKLKALDLLPEIVCAGCRNPNGEAIKRFLETTRNLSWGAKYRPKIALEALAHPCLDDWVTQFNRAELSGVTLLGLRHEADWQAAGHNALSDRIVRLRSDLPCEVLLIDNSTQLACEGRLAPGRRGRYMHDLMQQVLDAGGAGVVFAGRAFRA